MEIINNGKIYKEAQYQIEDELERDVVKNSIFIFGKQGIYFDIKKKVGKVGDGATIPDGFYLDLKLHTNPKLYFVENELCSHDVYGHIAEQILRFAIASDVSKYKIKQTILNYVKTHSEYETIINDFCKESSFDNCDALIDYVAQNNEMGAIVIIDDKEERLDNALAKINFDTEILEFKKFINVNDESDYLYSFDRFHEDISDIDYSTKNRRILDSDKLDTIIVPAREDGFKSTFIEQNCWYQIRISGTMINKIKYIAAYQVAPLSAITHIAKVRNIEKYKDTNKYIVYFDGQAQEIEHIKLDRPTLAPQSARYTCYDILMSAKRISDLF